MLRETASKAFATSLLLEANEKSTITRTKSTMISTTPKRLRKMLLWVHLHFQERIHLTKKKQKKTTHRNPNDMTNGVIALWMLLHKNKGGLGFLRILRDFCKCAFEGIFSLIKSVWECTLLLSIIDLHFCIFHLCNVSDHHLKKIREFFFIL